jgi:hypothetical protein
LLNLLGPKLTLSADRALFDAVRTFSGRLDMLDADSSIRRLAGTRREPVRKSR